MKEETNIARKWQAGFALARHLLATVFPNRAAATSFLSDSEISSVLQSESNK
jgi:hypothetical protein